MERKSAEPSAVEPSPAATAAPVAPSDLPAVLKSRLKGKKVVKAKTEAQKVAEAEALKAAKADGKKEKKKKDKKFYNEMNHYN